MSRPPSSRGDTPPAAYAKPAAEHAPAAAARAVDSVPSAPVAARSSQSGGSSSHSRVDSASGLDSARGYPRWEPPIAGSTHSNGETPSALDGRAMQRRMNARRPPQPVSTATILRESIAKHIEMQRRNREGR